MVTLQIKRHTDPNVDPKQLLRAHVDKLPIEKQYEFIAAACQLLGDRIDINDDEFTPKSKLLN